ncbi:MAG TPA: Dabb family protein [Vicinamibacterales bacterium]|nr:Dabb family protein [Vicinamibacterales bacterium]
MVTHVVLLRPRAGLSAHERAGLADALRAAIETIPSIRRARIGRRVTFGRGYEQSMQTNYEFVALLDFDDLDGLRAYLDHPAHEALATRFFQVLDDALMYDYEVEEGLKGLERFA